MEGGMNVNSIGVQVRMSNFNKNVSKDCCFEK